jgi:hypothetical protein
VKTYKGTPEVDDFDIAGPVIVHDPDGKRGPQYPLNPRFDLRNHSPTGFAWNYGGSGPAQLALALLADVTGDDDVAQNLYQAFKWAKIGRLGKGPWEMAEEEIRAWIMDKRIDGVTAEANEHLLKRT